MSFPKEVPLGLFQYSTVFAPRQGFSPDCDRTAIFRVKELQKGDKEQQDLRAQMFLRTANPKQYNYIFAELMFYDLP